jgi:SAM-dependent methyltransferase
VGCGKGSFLYSLRELGMRNVLGIDPYNEKEIEYENGLKIQNKKLGDVKGNWDIVMFHHSFEHLDNPINALKTVARLMKPNGNCVIRTPIMSTYAWEHYEIDWVQLDAPRHFVVPSVHSMDILSEICGLKLENVVYDSTAFQFWASEQYKRDIPLLDKHSYAINPKESMFSKSDISSFAKKANELNKAKRGDQAAFYLKKI